MKGLIFDIKRFAIHDGPGIRTTIFLKGCALECWWCHNPESRSREPETIVRTQKVNGHVFEIPEKVGVWMSVEEVMIEIEKERMFMDESDGGATLSGGEPLLQFEFAMALLKKTKSVGIHTALDTTGYVSRKNLGQAMDYVDLFLYDLKHLNDIEHKKYTSVSNKHILENLAFLYQHGKEIIIRFPVVPGINDQPEHIHQLATFLKTNFPRLKEIDLLPYHNIAAHKYQKFGIPNRMKDIQEPDKKKMNQLQNYFTEIGFTAKIGG